MNYKNHLLLLFISVMLGVVLSILLLNAIYITPHSIELRAALNEVERLQINLNEEKEKNLYLDSDFKSLNECKENNLKLNSRLEVLKIENMIRDINEK